MAIETLFDGSKYLDIRTTINSNFTELDNRVLTKAERNNVLELDNSDSFTPTADYHPATKLYVDEATADAGTGDMLKSTYDTNDNGLVDNADYNNAGSGLSSTDVNSAIDELDGDISGVDSRLTTVEGEYITATSTDTLTNKTIDLTDNTVSGTLAEFNAACSDDDFAFLGQVNTFTQFPITPSSAPTTDYQVANKKYVDDNAGDGGGKYSKIFTSPETWTPTSGGLANDLYNVVINTDNLSDGRVEIDGIKKTTGAFIYKGSSITIEGIEGIEGILDSFASPSSSPSGLAYDGTNLISCDYDSDTIYVHDGVSSTILDSFASPSSYPSGLAYDGTSLISCDRGSDTIYVHDGVSSTILNSFASPSSAPNGLAYNGTNLISCNYTSDTIYVYDGVSSTILNSFASPGSSPGGLAYDGTNLISCDSSSDTIYVHDGVSSTILNSFASPGTNPSGLAYDGTNLISCDYSSDTIYVHDNTFNGEAYVTVEKF